MSYIYRQTPPPHVLPPTRTVPIFVAFLLNRRRGDERETRCTVSHHKNNLAASRNMSPNNREAV